MNTRLAALAAGPVALLALVLFVMAVAVEGFESDLALARSPIASASSVVGLVGLVLLLLALSRLAGRLPSLQEGIGRVGVGVAFVGVALAIGGQWSMVFVVPGLASMDDATAEATTAGIPLVVAGFIVSFIVLAIGWILVAVALLRSGDVPRWTAVFLLVAGILAVAPLPVRFFVIALAVTAIEIRRTRVRTVTPAPLQHSHV